MVERPSLLRVHPAGEQGADAHPRRFARTVVCNLRPLVGPRQVGVGFAATFVGRASLAPQLRGACISRLS